MSLPGHVRLWAFVAPGMLGPALPQPLLPGPAVSPQRPLQRHLCRRGPQKHQDGRRRAVSRLSDGNFVFHLIQKL